MENKKRLEFYLDLIQSSLNDIEKYLTKIEYFLPIDYKNYLELTELHKDTLDAISFRFSKIQSILGEKIFKLFLETLGFDTYEKSFLEILSELEKLNILKRNEWLKLREIRNKIAHEYPDEIEEIIENLNEMIKSIKTFKKIHRKIREKLNEIK